HRGGAMRARVGGRGRTDVDADATDDDPVLGIGCRVLEQPDGGAVLGDALGVARIRDRGEALDHDPRRAGVTELAEALATLRPRRRIGSTPDVDGPAEGA